MGDTKDLAQGYVLANKTQFSAGLFLMEKLNITKGMRVLDVGCGPGDLTAYMADLVGEDGSVVGIDPSRERIDIALNNNNNDNNNNGLSSKTRKNLSFHVGRAEDLSMFPDGSFDVVYVNSTFHWVADQRRAMSEFFRVLAAVPSSSSSSSNGSRLGISGGSGDFVAIHERIKADVLAREPYRQYPILDGPKFLKQKEMEQLLDGAGFNSAKGTEFTINKIVKWAPDGETMINWLDTSSSGKTYGGIPLDLRPQAKEEMKREWAKVTTEKGIHMDMDLLVTVAYK